MNPAQRRSSVKDPGSSDLKEKLRKDCRDVGREHRRQILQQHRHSMSPCDLQAKLHADTLAAIRAELRQPKFDGAAFTEADIDDLLHDMQQQIMQEIGQELASLEWSEQQDQQHAAAMAMEHMQYLQSMPVGDGGLLCPVCKASQLVQRHGRLVCPAEGWHLNLAAESLQLSDIKHRLAAGVEEHAMSGCPGPLEFHIEDLFGSQSLTCSCSTCNLLAVVV